MHDLKGLVETPCIFFLIPEAVTEIHNVCFRRLCAISHVMLVLLNCMVLEQESGPLCETGLFPRDKF